MSLWLQRRIQGVRDEEHRDLDDPDDGCATLRVDACRSRITAIDAAVAGVAGRVTMSSSEVIDLLLDLRSRVAFSATLADAWNG